MRRANCEHWTQTTIGPGRRAVDCSGTCAIGHGNGRPVSCTTCGRCPDRKAVEDGGPAVLGGKSVTALTVRGATPDAVESALRRYVERMPLERIGDGIAVVAESVGADRLAKWYERVTGRPCGCPGRQALLSRVGAVKRHLLKGTS